MTIPQTLFSRRLSRASRVPTLAPSWQPRLTDVTKRLWYTASNAGGRLRTITVSTVTDAPLGTALTVIAAVEALAGSGGVTRNISAAGSAVLVSAIPSVATGRLGTDGAGLTYSFWVSDPAALVVDDPYPSPTTIVVTFTLTEDL